MEQTPKFKAELRIPTDQYAYISVWVENTPEAIVEAYKAFTALVKPQAGLSSKDFNIALDRYLTNGTGETATYLAMSPSQQACIQEIKKAYKRLQAKGVGRFNNEDIGPGKGENGDWSGQD